jgi:hypothetical protein
VTAREKALGRELRLARREQTGGYWVRLATTGRTLGEVFRDRSTWCWATTRTAYRGDGRPDHQRDGNPTDLVPASLDGLGRQPTRSAACARLVEHLQQQQAPALGYGPHPAVTERTPSHA